MIIINLISCQINYLLLLSGNAKKESSKFKIKSSKLHTKIQKYQIIQKDNHHNIVNNYFGSFTLL